MNKTEIICFKSYNMYKNVTWYLKELFVNKVIIIIIIYIPFILHTFITKKMLKLLCAHYWLCADYWHYHILKICAFKIKISSKIAGLYFI